MLTIGVIGLSEGNGHPYSWSAIFNGYDPEIMKRCPFPVISEYLGKQRFPDDAIKEGRVTHIWTQDRSVSQDIARACFIENVVDDYQQLVGQVDAVLLARDDAEFHYEMSAPFLEAGMPLYIDKPLATRVKDAEDIYALAKHEGQIFTCSALSFAKEFNLTDEQIADLGRIRYVDACVMKGWDKYAVHVIEPVLKILGHQGEIVDIRSTESGEIRTVTVTWQSGVVCVFSALGRAQSPMAIRIFGDDDAREMVFSDTFLAFRAALKAFVDVIMGHRVPPGKEFVLQVVRVIEEGGRNG